MSHLSGLTRPLVACLGLFAGLGAAAAEPATQTILPADALATLHDNWPTYTVASPDDIRQDIVAACRENPKMPPPQTVFAVDLDGDGAVDYAAVLIDRAQKKFLLVAILRRQQGYKPVRLQQVRWTGSPTKPVCIIVELKPAGEPGLAYREYFHEAPGVDATMEERDRYTQRIALESSRPGGTPQTCTGDVSADLYCSSGYYFEHGWLKRASACD